MAQLVSMLFQSWRNTLLFFGISNIIVVLLRSQLLAWGISPNVLIGGNIYLCVVNLISLILLGNGLRSKRTNSFMMAFYGNAFLKFFLTLIVVFIYVYAAKQVNKLGIVSLFLFYIGYMILEVIELKKITTELKNAKGKSSI